LEHPLSMRAIGELRSEDFARYRNSRLKDVSPRVQQLAAQMIDFSCVRIESLHYKRVS
jgi:phage FluMu protein gp41